MARIRIVDEWLRSPADRPQRLRVVMVVADTWAEQKVLMRAYSGCADQTRPSIVLHGSALAIGPASHDLHGPWGIHVDQQTEGRAQFLREQLELASRRLAGTKGNPPRLMDELPDFDRKATNPWAPGAPRNRASQPALQSIPVEPPQPAVTVGQFESDAAPVVTQSAPQVYQAHPDARTVMPFGEPAPAGTPPPAAPAAAGLQVAAEHRRATPRAWGVVPAPPAEGGQRAPLGKRARRPSASPRGVTKPLGAVVGRTMPLGFRLDDAERAVIDQLGREGYLTAAQVGEIAAVHDGAGWMAALMAKLAGHGLDIVAPGDQVNGQPTYTLRR